MINIRIGDLLLENGLITQEQLQDGLAKQKEDPGLRLGDALIMLGHVQEHDFLEVLAKRLNVPFIENPIYSVDYEAIQLVPEEVVRKYTALPLYYKNNALTVVTSDPLDFYGIEDIHIITGLNVETVLAGKKEIENTIEKVYAKLKTNEAVSSLNTSKEVASTISAEELMMMDRIDDAPVVKLLNNIIAEAIQANASDIHIEPTEKETVVRLRIDGDLREHVKMQGNIHPLLSTRVKILCNMNIAEKRLPQDGRFKYLHAENDIDVRVSSLPTIYGEKIVMRLLGSNQDVNYKFEDMGFSQHSIDKINELLNYSNGIILATGPTGSGKTTTLYTMINKIINPKINIVTVEDPVEKRIDGVNQVQVSARTGLSFASGLRSIFRQDPDVIMIGEIRDTETAEIAIRAAITGHLVLSTLHTNDSFSSLARLIDMGVEPFLLSTSIRGIISQRLVKRICPHCKTSVEVTSSDKKLLNDETLSIKHIGTGCKYCGFTGYKGRVAVDEILVITPEMQQHIASNSEHMESLIEIAKANKMRFMRDELLDLVKQGTTSVEEAIRLIYTAQ